MSKVKGEGIVKFYDAWIEGEFIYIQMEICFCNLNIILSKLPKFFCREQNQPINSEEYFLVWNILKQISDAVLGLHQKEIIHRDLKPANVLISNNYQVKLCDFGLSKWIRNALKSKTLVVGTKQYMAPEIYTDKHYTKNVDIYSLSVMALQFLGIFHGEKDENQDFVYAFEKFFQC